MRVHGRSVGKLVDVSGVFAPDWITRHGHRHQVVFIEFGRSCLVKSEIFKDSTEVYDFFVNILRCPREKRRRLTGSLKKQGLDFLESHLQTWKIRDLPGFCLRILLRILDIVP